MEATIEHPKDGNPQPGWGRESMVDSLAILCIEDNRADFLLIEREIKRSDLPCRCHWVDNRDAMLAALEHERWDLVLSDYAVPGISFPENLAYLKRRYPSLPVILVSGTIGEVKGSVMVRLGADAFVSKDYLVDLLPAVRRQLGLAGKEA
ncbi:MAG: response regulator [Betaproteobacteria bacterium]|nr:response regulator [Betaproteobacteria bacterium]